MKRSGRAGRRRLLGSAIVGVAGLVALDRTLAATGREVLRPDRPIHTVVAVRAPIARVWAELSNLAGQPRWMHDLKRVEILTPGEIGVGTRAQGLVRIFGIPVSDPIEISAWDPPHLFALRHVGFVSGRGEIRLEELPDRTTIVTWDEILVAPFLPVVLGLLARPVFGRVFAADLRRLADLVESGG